MPPTQVIGSIADDIVGALARRSDALAGEWQSDLQARQAVRPRRVLPTDLLQEHMPAVIQWVTAFLADGTEAVPREAIARLRGLVRLRREQGYRIEELLAELELLGRVLFDALQEEVEERGADLSPAATIALAQRLQRGLSVVATIIGGLYRDRTEAEGDELADADTGTDFIRVLMHELRNPLSAAQAAAQVLEDLGDRVSADRRRLMAARIRQRLRRANDLLDSVTSLALIETEPIGSVERRAPLRRVVEHVVADAADLAVENGVTVEVDGDIPEVIVDVNRCELVLYNFVRNAINYADEDESERWVRISAVRSSDGACRVEVCDNGIGIDETDRAHIFERFFRAPGGRASGHGLGLAIARDAAEQLGGRIDCESTPGDGSTFSLILPTSVSPVDD